MFALILLTAVPLLVLELQSSAPSDTTTASKTVAESAEVRYARAQLRLAEANLKRVAERNKQLARSVPSSVVAEYQDDVRVAQSRLQQATTGRSANEFQVWLERAEAEHRSAETAWKNAIAVNKIAAGTFVPLDIERFRLGAEVAKLQLERGQSLVNAGREVQLQWQSELLDNQVQRLKEESRDATPGTGLYPRWWW
jgi:hypothetical protein